MTDFALNNMIYQDGDRDGFYNPHSPLDKAWDQKSRVELTTSQVLNRFESTYGTSDVVLQITNAEVTENNLKMGFLGYTAPPAPTQNSSRLFQLKNLPGAAFVIGVGAYFLTRDDDDDDEAPEENELLTNPEVLIIYASDVKANDEPAELPDGPAPAEDEDGLEEIDDDSLDPLETGSIPTTGADSPSPEPADPTDTLERIATLAYDGRPPTDVRVSMGALDLDDIPDELEPSDEDLGASSDGFRNFTDERERAARALLEEAEAILDPADKIAKLKEAATKFTQARNDHEAIQVLSRVAEIQEEQEWHLQFAQTLGEIASLLSKEGRHLLAANSYSRAAAIVAETGLPGLAVDYLTQAEIEFSKLAERNDPIPKIGDPERGIVNEMIEHANRVQTQITGPDRDWEQILRINVFLLLLCRSLNNIEGVGSSHFNIGLAYRKVGNHKQAAEHFYEAMRIYFAVSQTLKGQPEQQLRAARASLQCERLAKKSEALIPKPAEDEEPEDDALEEDE